MPLLLHRVWSIHRFHTFLRTPHCERTSCTLNMKHLEQKRAIRGTLFVTDSEAVILNLYNMCGFISRWKVIAGEVSSPGKWVFSLLWFYLHSQRFGVQPYGLSTAFSRPLLQSLWNEKWLKRARDKSTAPLSPLWTLHSFALRKPGDDTFNNSIVSTSASLLLFCLGSLYMLPTHPTLSIVLSQSETAFLLANLAASVVIFTWYNFFK